MVGGGHNLDDPALPSGELFGRDRELGVLRRTLASARSGRFAGVWLSGLPGSGKTALCTAALAAAVDFRQVVACCVEGESVLSLGLLLSVVRPLRRSFAALPPGHRAALGGLLGEQAPADPVELLSLGAATLALLAEASEAQPLLLVIDDAHWIDTPSAVVLSFALRRLDADAVAAVIASRQPSSHMQLDSTVTTLEVGGLDNDASRELLLSRAATADHVCQALCAATGGLPLALTDIVEHLSPDERAGRRPLPPLLPVGDRLLAEFRGRLEPLPERTRRALGTVAAAGTDTASIPAALARSGLDWGDLSAAEQLGVVSIDAAGPAFAHPLFRTAALATLSSAERRFIEAALAAVVADPERRALHLLRSAAGTSADLADALEATADAVARRRGALPAATIRADAAPLTPPGPARTSRLLRAAGELAAVARVTDAEPLITEVIGSTDDPVQHAEATLLSVWARNWADPAAACADATVAAERVDPVSPDHARRLRFSAAVIWTALGDYRRSVELVMRGGSRPAGETPSTESLLAALPLALNNRLEEVRSRLPVRSPGHWADLGRGLANGIGAEAVTPAAMALLCSERLDEAIHLVDAAIDATRAAGRPLHLPSMLVARSAILFVQGYWHHADAATNEAMRLGLDVDQPFAVAAMSGMYARIPAARGDGKQVASLWAASAAYVEAFLGGSKPYFLHARALYDLGCGNDIAAVDALEELRVLAERIGFLNPLAIGYHGDLIEALVRTDQRRRAERIAAGLADSAGRTGLRWPAAIALRGQAQLADARESEALFAASLEAWDVGFEGARTRLAWAERRQDRAAVPGGHRRTGDDDLLADDLLADAAAAFDRLGAVPWAGRARSRLSGRGSRPDPPVHVLAALTPGESSVALAVAEGISNREAATRLFISSKTVEHHLSSIYAKLGIRSRAQLARLIATATTGTRPGESRTGNG